jgi:hypothetical protein
MWFRVWLIVVDVVFTTPIYPSTITTSFSSLKATSLLLGAIVWVGDVTIATISSDVVVVGRCNCRLILVVIDVHTGGV